MESTIYTDGHGVKVTNTEFITGKTSYKLEGIVNASTSIIKASLTPAVLLIVLGIAAIATGLLHFYSSAQIDSLSPGSLILTPNRIAVIAGVILLLTGFLMSISMRDKYAVHIVTAEGHKEPVVSKKKDYINQIVIALQKALKWR